MLKINCSRNVPCQSFLILTNFKNLKLKRIKIFYEKEKQFSVNLQHKCISRKCLKTILENSYQKQQTKTNPPVLLPPVHVLDGGVGQQHPRNADDGQHHHNVLHRPLVAVQQGVIFDRRLREHEHVDEADEQRGRALRGLIGWGNNMMEFDWFKRCAL